MTLMKSDIRVMADVSVVICAYLMERWRELTLAVASLQQQRLLPREIIVVVDHNPELLRRVRQSIPGVIAVENREVRGLSGARNTGVALTRGSVIAFLDDDAEAAPDWLYQLNNWLQSDDVAGAGGTVEPNWEGESPKWFPEEFRWVVGCSYRGLPETSSPVRNLFGGCMCVRREVFDAAGGFHSAMGRSNGRPMGCEETEFCIRVRQRRPDWRFIYEPRAVASHRVPAARKSWEYFCSRCYAEGLSKAQVSSLVGAGDGLSSERPYTFQTLPRGILRGVVDTFGRGDVWGLARSGAIIGGLAYTLLGYLVGVVSGAVVEPRKAWRESRSTTL